MMYAYRHSGSTIIALERYSSNQEARAAMTRHWFPLVFTLLAAMVGNECAPQLLTSVPTPDLMLDCLNGDLITLNGPTGHREV